MISLSNVITLIFYFVMLGLCVFIVVHVSMQVKDIKTLFVSLSESIDVKNLFKMISMIILSIIMFSFLYSTFINKVTSFKANEYEKNNYSKAVAELSDALTLEFNVYGYDTYSTAENLASSFNYRLPIKDLYYVPMNNEEANTFSNYEIIKYKLKDFEYKPTLVTYDGVLMSIIKFKKDCKYVNKKYLGRSDCIIEVDINHYKEPNQIGEDRTLFAIDGVNHTVVFDRDFFK